MGNQRHRPPKYRCTNCGFVGHDDDWDLVYLSYGNEIDPPETEAYCPQCKADWDHTEEIEEEAA